MTRTLDHDDQVQLEFASVDKAYRGAVPFYALRRVNLRIQEGEMIAVTGRSGSGKTTLLNILGLLDRPSSGSYSVAGVNTASLPEASLTALRACYFGFVFQEFHLLPDRTALENAELGLLYRAFSPSARRAAAASAIERVGLSHRLRAFPTTLSGGERQRLAIARALAQEPRVLLCDEPTGNLDRTNASMVLDLLTELHREQLTVVIVTHDQEISNRLPRVVTIDDGMVEV